MWENARNFGDGGDPSCNVRVVFTLASSAQRRGSKCGEQHMKYYFVMVFTNQLRITKKNDAHSIAGYSTKSLEDDVQQKPFRVDQELVSDHKINDEILRIPSAS